MQTITTFIRELYAAPESFIPLHAPVFTGREKEYLCDCVDSTFVSSVGEYVDRFEAMTADYTGAKRAVAVVNGTSGLEMALTLMDVRPGDLVLTQALTFVATANAISHVGAQPVFLDSDKDTFGMNPECLEYFLEHHEGPRIAACLPVHILGHPCRIREIRRICDKWDIPLIEDAAEGLGSFRGGQHVGTFGDVGVLSYNGNKTITTGGGGMLLFNDTALGNRAKHLTTTAKEPHPWIYKHDQVGWNHRMPNINAALGCAQMEKLQDILSDKRAVAQAYRDFFAQNELADFIDEPEDCWSNFWLNTVVFKEHAQRDEFLEYSNKNGVMTRPLWTLMPDLPMYANAPRTDLSVARDLACRAVNLPSGPRL